MRIPIAHCLAWPARMGTPAPRLDLARVATLSFEEPDSVRFPALRDLRAQSACRRRRRPDRPQCRQRNCGARIRRPIVSDFAGIPALVEATLDAAERAGAMAEPQSVEDAVAIDQSARKLATGLVPEIAAMAS